MQFIQNSMGMYCQLYEQWHYLSHLLSWHDPKMTDCIFKVTLVSGIFLMIIASIIPWNILALMIGWTVICVNTQFFKLSFAVIMATLSQWLEIFELWRNQRQFKLESFPDIVKIGTTSNRFLIKIWENQCLLQSEWVSSDILMGGRPPFGNADGTKRHSNKDLLKLPISCQFKINSRWMIATPGENDGVSINKKISKQLKSLEDVDIDTQILEGGWCYGDADWKNFVGKAGKGKLTRRRLWVREIHIDQNIETQTHSFLNTISDKQSNHSIKNNTALPISYYSVPSLPSADTDISIPESSHSSLTESPVFV